MMGDGAAQLKCAQLDRRHLSWSQLIEAAQLPGAAGAGDASKRERLSSRPGYGAGWYGKLSYEQAIELLRGTRRDVKSEERIAQLAREQAGKVVRRRASHEYAYDVTGDFFDVAAVVEGRPENWLYRENANSGFHEVVRFFVDPAMSHGVDKLQNQDRIIAVAAAALTLEACGIPVEVIAIQWHGGSNVIGYVHTQQINNAGEPLDLVRLATLAHPSYPRRIHFRLVEQTCPQWSNWSYGGAQPLPVGYFEAEYPGPCVYIPPSHGDVTPTCEALLKIVQQKLGAIGADDGGAL